MRKRSQLWRRAVLLLPVLLAGCGSGIGGGPAINVNFINANTSGTPGTYSGKSFYEMLSDVSENALTAAAWGDGAPDSLKFSIISVQICEGLKVKGTAWSDNTGCSTLYSATDDQSAYDNNEAPAPYLDMMDMAATRASLNKGIAISPGTYKYGIISWYKPVKVKGCVSMTPSGTACTSGNGTNKKDSGGNYYYEQSDVATAGTASEATVVLNNGGSWFKFQTPWEYKGDESAQLDLVFNPDNLLKASDDASNYAIRQSASGGPAISVPLLSLTPVVHKSSETASKEVYRITHASFVGAIRVELYYITQDSKKSIYGVDVRSEYTGATNTNAMDPPTAFSVSTSGSTVTLKDWNKKEILTLTRSVSGSATVNCDNASSGTGVCGTTGSITAASSFVGTVAL